jgi:hypothetical protein
MEKDPETDRVPDVPFWPFKVSAMFPGTETEGSDPERQS